MISLLMAVKQAEHWAESLPAKPNSSFFVSPSAGSDPGKPVSLGMNWYNSGQNMPPYFF